jgi:hypothetical protein
MIVPIFDRASDVLPLRTLRSRTEEKDHCFPFLCVLDAIPGADVDLQFPHAIPEEAVLSEIALREAINPAKHGNPSALVRELHKPVAERVSATPVSVIADRNHGSF